MKCFIEQAIASHKNYHIKVTIGVGMGKFTGRGSKCMYIYIYKRNHVDLLNYVHY